MNNFHSEEKTPTNDPTIKPAVVSPAKTRCYEEGHLYSAPGELWIVDCSFNVNQSTE